MAPTAWQLLRGLDAWQVTQIPRQPQRQPPGGPQDEGDLLAGQRAAALGAAYHGGAGPVGFAWVRDRAGGPVQVLARLPCWIRISGVADSLLAARDPEPARAIRPSLEDGLLAAWPGPFGWLVFPEPVSRAELEGTDVPGVRRPGGRAAVRQPAGAADGPAAAGPPCRA